MLRIIFSPLIVALVCSPVFSSHLEAAYVIRHGKLWNTNEISWLSVQEHFSVVTESYDQQDWEEVIRHAKIVIKNFPTSPFAHEAVFYLGAGYFHLGDLEHASRELSHYLRRQTPIHFEEAIKYKFTIAEQYKRGAKKPLLGWKALPKWVPAREDAIAIYDEVISALPNHDLGAQALFGKAKLLYRDDEFKSSVETYQALIRRFPQHPLVPESYIGIGEVYLLQAKTEYPDPDFLDLAEINFRKFKQDCPTDTRHAVSMEMLNEMRELYANNFYEMGLFYARTHKPHAAVIYFQQVIDRYPETQIATASKEKLSILSDKAALTKGDVTDARMTLPQPISIEPQSEIEKEKAIKLTPPPGQ